MNGDFAYRLVVLTHGDSRTLPEAVGAFIANADPLPRETVIVVDGPRNGAVDDVEAVLDRARLRVQVAPDTAQRGFCGATYRAWREAAKDGPEWVVHLEHDFLLERHTEWAQLATVMDGNPQLAQMQLMRNAVNQEEKAAGGLFEYRRDQYSPQWEDDLLPPNDPDAISAYDPGAPHWHQHRAYITTNVSLMRRQWMVENPWPDPELMPSNCEGLFGFGLVQEGWWFGVWGDGSPWTRHIGVRDGSGFAY